ncbi:MAG: hypothetical protein ACKPEN_01655 [Planktothrix sp.]|uniref:hypothetical protein n=1 Tax=Planktothrix sp. TaxID=3088171 RepID=UPI0038D45519
MPISNSPSTNNSDLTALIEALSSIKFSGGGFPQFRYCQGASVAIEPEKERLVVDRTVDPQLREIIVKNVTPESTIQLFWDGQTAPIFELNYNDIWSDNNDGGIKLTALSSSAATINVTVRSESRINYQIGVPTMPYFPIQVSLHFPTGGNFLPVDDNDLTEFSTTTYQDNISRLFNSDQGVTGFKAVSFDCFTPGEELKIMVNAPTGLYGSMIVLQLIHPLKLVRVLTDIASDLINPESASLPNNLMGRLTQDSWMAEINSATGGELTFKPNFNQCMGRFVALNPNTNAFDTAIITGYTPNADPLVGGTFTLGGF